MIQYFQKQHGRIVSISKLETGCWINIALPFNQEELDKVSQDFGIPPDFLTDSLDIDERARFDYEEDIRFILINTPLLNDVTDDISTLYVTVPIGIILTPEHLITISSYNTPVIQHFLELRSRNIDPADKIAFTLSILDYNVRYFLTCLKDLNVRRNQIERELYQSSRNRQLQQLLSIEKSLVYFVTALSSNSILNLKMQRTDFLKIKQDEEKSDLLEDIIIDNNQAREMANIYSNILSGTMDAFASIISNNLNLFIQRLTLITIILMLPTVIASFFGMNVPIPGSESPYMFYMIIGTSLCLSLGLIFIFIKKRWI